MCDVKVSQLSSGSHALRSPSETRDDGLAGVGFYAHHPHVDCSQRNVAPPLPPKYSSHGIPAVRPMTNYSAEGSLQNYNYNRHPHVAIDSHTSRGHFSRSFSCEKYSSSDPLSLENENSTSLGFHSNENSQISSNSFLPSVSNSDSGINPDIFNMQHQDAHPHYHHHAHNYGNKRETHQQQTATITVGAVGDCDKTNNNSLATRVSKRLSHFMKKLTPSNESLLFRGKKNRSKSSIPPARSPGEAMESNVPVPPTRLFAREMPENFQRSLSQNLSRSSLYPFHQNANTSGSISNNYPRSFDIRCSSSHEPKIQHCSSQSKPLPMTPGSASSTGMIRTRRGSMAAKITSGTHETPPYPKMPLVNNSIGTSSTSVGGPGCPMALYLTPPSAGAGNSMALMSHNHYPNEVTFHHIHHHHHHHHFMPANAAAAAAISTRPIANADQQQIQQNCCIFNTPQGVALGNGNTLESMYPQQVQSLSAEATSVSTAAHEMAVNALFDPSRGGFVGPNRGMMPLVGVMNATSYSAEAVLVGTKGRLNSNNTNGGFILAQQQQHMQGINSVTTSGAASSLQLEEAPSISTSPIVKNASSSIPTAPQQHMYEFYEGSALSAFKGVTSPEDCSIPQLAEANSSSSSTKQKPADTSPYSAQNGPESVPHCSTSNRGDEDARGKSLLRDEAHAAESCSSTRIISMDKMQQQQPADLQDPDSSFKKMGWYWGSLDYKNAEHLLNGRPEGTFLVRDSNGNPDKLCLSFRVAESTYHTRIERKDGRYNFSAQPASISGSSILEFIEQAVLHNEGGQFHYFIHSHQPGSPAIRVVLRYPLSRHQIVHSLKHLCRFQLRQTLSHEGMLKLSADHLLPPALIGYLCEPQYYFESVDRMIQAYRDLPPLKFSYKLISSITCLTSSNTSAASITVSGRGTNNSGTASVEDRDRDTPTN